MYDYNNKSNGKQRLKSKKQIRHGVRFSSSLLHYVCEYVSVLYIDSFVLFFRVHIQVISYSICLSV